MQAIRREVAIMQQLNDRPLMSGSQWKRSRRTASPKPMLRDDRDCKEEGVYKGRKPSVLVEEVRKMRSDGKGWRRSLRPWACPV